MSSAYLALQDQLYKVNALYSALGIFGWDQQTFMPKGGAPCRAHHISTLSGMAHALFVSEETQKLLAAAEKEVVEGSVEAAVVRVTRRGMDLLTKLPEKLVLEKAKLATEGHELWVEARKNNDFASFLPTLERLFELARETAECFGYKDHIYDALLDTYEEGATKKDVEAMFDSIRGPLVDLVHKVKNSPNQPDTSFLNGDWRDEDQKAFCLKVTSAIGFDYNRGRLDTAPHPFCGGWSIGDVRMTTRYERFLSASIFGSLHEAGHGMYEQGSPMEWDRLPVAGGVSLGIHESQSRLWENIVGRSKPFWKHFLPVLQSTFPELERVDLDTFYRAVNCVSPSLIRVEADELTYNLHIMVRFELECAILTGELKVADLPEAWRAKYKSYLGVDVPTDSLGCLQDVHWSGGSVGYFPTYSMGNLLSYQIWASLQKDIQGADALMAAGRFEPIKGWLVDKVYSKGSLLKPKDLIQQVTGKPMGAEDYLAGVTAKYSELYRL